MILGYSAMVIPWFGNYNYKDIGNAPKLCNRKYVEIAIYEFSVK